MQAIDKLGKIYYFYLKNNRSVDDSKGKDNYKSIEFLSRTRLQIKLRKSY